MWHIFESDKPKEADHYVVCVKRGKYKGIYTAAYLPEAGFLTDEEVLFWMELPKLPKELEVLYWN